MQQQQYQQQISNIWKSNISITKIQNKFQIKNSLMQKFAKVNLSNQYMVDMSKVLGKGSTGCVYEGTDLHSNTKVAVKVIQLSTIDNQVTQYLLKMQKIALMELRNPYVLKGLRILQDGKYCFIVTQYCNGGTLKKYIQDNRKLSQETSLKIIKGILEGYLDLVEKKVVHRDLKPANVMMHDQYPKIIDFGYCEIEGYAKPSLQYNVGSPSYMSPQSYEDSIYNQKTEVWAIGVILYECLTGKTLDEGMNMTEIYRQLHEQGVQYPDHVPERSRRIISECLQRDPKKRPACSELLKKHFSNGQSDLKQTMLSQKTMPTERKIPTSRSIIIDEQTSSNNLDTVLKKDIIAYQTKIQGRKTHQPQPRTPFGVLTNQHQQHQQYQYQNTTKPSDMNKQQAVIQNRARPSYTQYDRNPNPRQSFQPYFHNKFAQHRPQTTGTGTTTRRTQQRQPQNEHNRQRYTTEYSNNPMMRSTMLPSQSRTQQTQQTQHTTGRREQGKQLSPSFININGAALNHNSNNNNRAYSMYGSTGVNNVQNSSNITNNDYRTSRQPPSPISSPASQQYNWMMPNNNQNMCALMGRKTVTHAMTDRLRTGSYYA